VRYDALHEPAHLSHHLDRDIPALTPAGVLCRLFAVPLDGAIVASVWLLGLLWAIIVYRVGLYYPLGLDGIFLLACGAATLGLVLSAVYFVGFIGTCGQTPGKMLFAVRVVRRDGQRVGYARAFVRWVGYGLGILTLGLGFLGALLNRDRRALHDCLAGTRVVRE
jgi:uncharacterized RDD family membrane protein YckC